MDIMTERQKLRRKRRIHKRILGAVIAVLIIAALVCAVWFITKAMLKDQPKPTPTDPTPAVTTPQTTEPPTQEPTLPPTEPPTESRYNASAVDNSEIHRGFLILVNEYHEYISPEDQDLVNTYEKRTKGKYKFRDDDILFNAEAQEHMDKMLVDFNAETGVKDLIILSCLRSIEKQTELFERKVKQTDYETAKKWVAIPGYSEHHTGLAVDFGIYDSKGSHDYTGEGDYKFINDYCYKYGFILRYPTNKTDITGIGFEPWHFRYTGYPHAEIASTKGICWEEYIDLLKQYPFDGEHLNFTAFDGTEYEIYYIAADTTADATLIYTPKTGEYRVSGNNVDGFIVTCKK